MVLCGGAIESGLWILGAIGERYRRNCCIFRQFKSEDEDVQNISAYPPKLTLVVQKTPETFTNKGFSIRRRSWSFLKNRTRAVGFSRYFDHLGCPS
jgi:hypothetical protein